MKAPSLRGLSIEDFRNLTPDVRKGLEQLSTVLSPFLADATDTLAGGLTLGNLDAIIKRVEVKTPAAPVVPGPVPDNADGGLYNLDGIVHSSNVVVYRRGAEVFYDGWFRLHQDPAGWGTLATADFPPTTLNQRYVAVVGDHGLTAYGTAIILVTTAGNLSIPNWTPPSNLGTNPYVFLTGFRYTDPEYEPPPPPAPVETPDAGPITVSLESSGRRLKSGRPSIVIPVGATEVSGTRTSEVVVPAIAWEHTKDGVVIKKIRGLDPGKRYHLTLLIAS